MLPNNLDVQREVVQETILALDMHRRVLRLAEGAVALKGPQGVMLEALLQKVVDHRAEDRQGCRLPSRCQHVGVISAETQRG